MRRNPNQAPKIWMIMGFLPFVLDNLHLFMASISWPEWPGYAKGTEFSVVDALALALYLSLPPTRHPLPFRLSMAFYFFAVLLSTIQTDVPMAAIFYLWQIGRMFLVYAAVARGCAVPRVPLALLQGMAAGLLMEAGLVLWQRIGSHMIQAVGTFGHQNLLGVISHFVVFPFFALMLGGRNGRFPMVVVFAGVIVEVLTTSRATVGLAAFGYATVFMLSALRQWTSRKAVVLLTGAMLGAVVTPLALSSVAHRGTESIESSDEERIAFQTAAAMMLADHPMGVGANNYVIVANSGGYNAAAGVAPTLGSRSAHVHNIYRLVAAETGYLGLIAFVILLLCPLAVTLRSFWRYRTDYRADMLIGLGTALLVVYVHSFFEWIFITYPAQYMFAIDVGLVAGLAQQLGYWASPYPQRGRSAARTMTARPVRNTR
jgi:hypothetical protein